MKKTLLTISSIAVSIMLSASSAYGEGETMNDLLKSSHIEAPQKQIDYNERMRSLIEKISKYSRGFKDSFVISVRNGESLMKAQSDSMGLTSATDELFLRSIDGIFVDGYSYGYSKYEQIMYGAKNPKEEKDSQTRLLKEYLEHGKFVGVFDHINAKTEKNSLQRGVIVNKVQDVYNDTPISTKSKDKGKGADNKVKDLSKKKPMAITSESAIGYVKEIDHTTPYYTVFDEGYGEFKKALPKGSAYSFDREHTLTLKDYLKSMPKPKGMNSKPIYKLSDAKTFLYIANLDINMSTDEFVETLAKTNYDVIIMSSFFKNNIAYKADTIEKLKYKRAGVPRLVLANINVAVAEKGAYYWQDTWKKGDPSFIKYRQPNTVNSYFTNFWDPSWQYVITGHNQSYMYGIMLQHFDGVLIEGLTVSKYFQDVTSGFTTPQ